MAAIIHQLYSTPIFLISCRYQFLQVQLIEVSLKILNKIGLHWIVAVAVDDLAPEVVAVMPELVLDVGKLREKLVVFSFLSTVKIAVV